MIIGITGTDGSGKGSAVSYLVDKLNFTHYSSRDLIMAEVKKRNLEPNRSNLRLVGNEMREEGGADVIVKKALEKIEIDNIENAVIESVRTVKEAETLIQAGGILLAVDAPIEVRYKRIVERGGDTDKVSFSDFVEQEEAEMNDEDPNGMQKAKVMKMAGQTISNCESLESLYKSIDNWLIKLGYVQTKKRS